MAGLFIHKINAIRDTNQLLNIQGIYETADAYNDPMMEAMRDLQYDNSTMLPHRVPREFQVFNMFDTRSPAQRAEDMRQDEKTGEYYMSNQRLFNDLPEQIRPKQYSVRQHKLAHLDDLVDHNNHMSDILNALHGQGHGAINDTVFTPQYIAPTALMYGRDMIRQDEENSGDNNGGPHAVLYETLSSSGITPPFSEANINSFADDLGSALDATRSVVGRRNFFS